MDLQALLKTTLAALNSQINSEKSAVYYCQDGTDTPFKLAYSTTTETVQKSLGNINTSEIIKLLSNSNEALAIDDVSNNISNKDERMLLSIFHPGLIAPLVSRNGLIGLLIVGPKSKKASFSDEDKEFLSLLSNQISVAIENARLYDAEKKAIAELQSTQQQLVHTERLAALGEMSAKIAHEINNPLGIIKNYLMLIGKAQKDPSQSYQYLDIVGQEIDRITNIVRELLQFHRPQHVDYKQINVLNVLEEVLNFLNPQLEHAKIKLSRMFSPECPEVEASAENLKQVFINIILNAADVLPDGGKIDVNATSESGNLNIRFQDSGPGVSEEMLPRIFEPFFTTKEEGKGTGLGLSVCYGIIKKHNGTINFENTESGGCVVIVLPGIGKKNE